MSTNNLLKFHLSKTGLIILAINCFVFGGCIVMIALGAANGPVILLTIGTGLYTVAGFAGIYIAKKQIN